MGKFTVIIDICRFMMSTQRVYRTIITQSCPLLTWKVHQPRVCRTPSKISFLQYLYSGSQIFEIETNFMAGRRVRQWLESNLDGLKMSFKPRGLKFTLFLMPENFKIFIFKPKSSFSVKITKMITRMNSLILTNSHFFREN